MSDRDTAATLEYHEATRHSERSIRASRHEYRFRPQAGLEILHPEASLHRLTGHMHAYGDSIEVRDRTTGEALFRADAMLFDEAAGIEHRTHDSREEGLSVYREHAYGRVATYNDTPRTRSTQWRYSVSTTGLGTSTSERSRPSRAAMENIEGIEGIEGMGAMTGRPAEIEQRHCAFHIPARCSCRAADRRGRPGADPGVRRPFPAAATGSDRSSISPSNRAGRRPPAD